MIASYTTTDDVERNRCEECLSHIFLYHTCKKKRINLTEEMEENKLLNWFVLIYGNKEILIVVVIYNLNSRTTGTNLQ